MPKWVPVEAIGIVMRGPTGIILSMTGGGYWCLDLSTRLKAEQLGTRVKVTGMRVGFNEIAVDKIVPA
jgi:hypothetical protein